MSKAYTETDTPRRSPAHADGREARHERPEDPQDLDRGLEQKLEPDLSPPQARERPEPRFRRHDHDTTSSYGRSISYACEQAWPHPTLSTIRRDRLTPGQHDELREWNLKNRWSPNQLGHAVATQVRKVAGWGP